MRTGVQPLERPAQTIERLRMEIEVVGKSVAVSFNESKWRGTMRLKAPRNRKFKHTDARHASVSYGPDNTHDEISALRHLRAVLFVGFK